MKGGLYNMTQQEKEILKEELTRMIENSKEVIEKTKKEKPSHERSKMLYYERGMIRGLERSLSTIEDLEAIKEDRKALKRKMA